MAAAAVRAFNYWGFYWEDDTNASIQDPRVTLITGLHVFFRGAGAPLLRNVDWTRQAVISFHYNDFRDRSPFPDFADALREEPDGVLKCMGLSLCLVRSDFEPDVPPHRITVRIQCVAPLTSLRDIKSSSVGKYVSVRGNIIRVSAVRPLVLRMSFTCLKCGADVVTRFEDGKFDLPTACSDAGCRSRAFKPDYASARAVDWQKLRLQELEADSADAGRVPRTLEVELTEDLCDACVPGDVVTVGGVVKAIEAEVASGTRGAGNKRVFLMYVEARSVSSHKASSERAGGDGADAGDPLAPTAAPAAAAAAATAGVGLSKAFSEKELRFIARVRAHRDPFALVVASMCPTIFGHETVKAGMLLGLFGGTPRTALPLAVEAAAAAAATAGDAPGRGDAFRGPSLAAGATPEGADGGGSGGVSNAALERSSGALPVRSDPHVLVVGDPGMGKSQMLQALIGLAPRGVYVCGNTTSATGLTVTLVRDPVSGEQALEAGALVLSDQGVCCIDEFDKMGQNHQALLEAMEQQRISIAKAGIVSSLSARASVIAAANPAAGHYDKGKTIVENLRMTPALLSRFDLIFILVDRPDAARDRALSDHVMAMHGKSGGAAAAARSAHGLPHDDEPDAVQFAASAATAAGPGGPSWRRGEGRDADAEPLDARLRRAVAGIPASERIPPSLLKKYVAYARRCCFPALTPGAAAVLQAFYLSLRRSHGSTDSTPITTRQLESLIRLSEARAKVELREWVSEADARDVVDLMRESLFDAATDDFGSVDFARASGMGMGKQVKLFVAGLTKASANRGSAVFTTSELERFGRDMRLSVPSFADFLDVLNQQSYLLKRGPGEWKLTTSGAG